MCGNSTLCTLPRSTRRELRTTTPLCSNLRLPRFSVLLFPFSKVSVNGRECVLPAEAAISRVKAAVLAAAIRDKLSCRRHDGLYPFKAFLHFIKPSNVFQSPRCGDKLTGNGGPSFTQAIERRESLWSRYYKNRASFGNVPRTHTERVSNVASPNDVVAAGCEFPA